MDLFSVLGEFLNWLGTLLPRWQLIRSTEGAVIFRRKKDRVVRGPRIIWWLPCLSDLEIVPVVRQVIDLPPQTLMSADRETVIAGGVVVYSITDLQKFLVENHDADQSIAEVAGAALRDAIVGKTIAEIQETDGRKKLDRRLTSFAQETLQSFGIEIERMRLTNFSRAHIINYVGATPLLPQQTEEE